VSSDNGGGLWHKLLVKVEEAWETLHLTDVGWLGVGLDGLHALLKRGDACLRDGIAKQFHR
jgi:hypothetical protein